MAAALAVGLLSAKLVVVKGRRRDLRIRGKPDLFGRAAEVHFLFHELIGAVLARDFGVATVLGSAAMRGLVVIFDTTGQIGFAPQSSCP